MNFNFKFGFIFALISCVLTASCNQNPSTENTNGQTIVDPSVASSDIKLEAGKIYSNFPSLNGSFSFALYLPYDYTMEGSFPAIIFLDPHADGSFPISKYKFLADKFGFVLIGSNTSKNGMTFENSAELVGQLTHELSERFHLNVDQISLAGFSGGAKAVLVAASLHPQFNSIIYCGAAVPTPGTELPPALGIAGTHDMNYTEVLGFSASLDGSKNHHALLEWNGKHEWPDSSTFQFAFYWVLFNSEKKSLKEDKFLQPFLDMVEKKLHTGNSFEQVKRLKLILAFIQDKYDTREYSRKLHHLLSTEGYKSEAEKESRLVQWENTMKQMLLDAFNNNTIVWWKQEIVQLNSEKENAINHRLLGYISLAGYSVANNSIKGNYWDLAKKSLEIYKLSDPENPDQPYLSACLYAKLNKPDSALIFLNQAVDQGFRDLEKLENDEMLFSLKNLPGYNQLINRIHS